MTINLNNLQTVQELEHLLAYAFGLTKKPPATNVLAVEPGRVASFLNEFLRRHRLEIHRTGPTAPRVTNPTTLKP